MKSILAVEKSETIADSLQAVNFAYAERPVTVGDLTSQTHKGIVNIDSGQIIGLIGKDRYVESYPAMFGAVIEALQAENVPLKAQGSKLFQGGAKGLIALKVDGIEEQASRKLGEAYSASIIISASMDSTWSLNVKLFIERLVCLNGMKAHQLEKECKIRLSKGAGDRMQVRLPHISQKIDMAIATTFESYSRLRDVKMSKSEMISFAEKIIPGTHTRSQNQRNTLEELFMRGAGNEGGTRYDAFNAVTEFISHHRGTKETEQNSREENRLLSFFNQSGKVIEDAYKLLAS